MTASDTPWEPPLAGSEVQQLIGALNRLRTTFRWKADDLDAIGLQTRIVSRRSPSAACSSISLLWRTTPSPPSSAGSRWESPGTPPNGMTSSSGRPTFL